MAPLRSLIPPYRASFHTAPSFCTAIFSIPRSPTKPGSFPSRRSGLSRRRKPPAARRAWVGGSRTASLTYLPTAYVTCIGLASLASRRFNARTAIVVGDGTLYGEGVAEAFYLAARGNRMDVIERFQRVAANELSRVADEVSRRKPDVVFYGGLDTQASLLLAQLRQRSAFPKMLGGDGICTRLLTQATAIDGTIVCAEGGALLEHMRGGADWKQRYDAAFPRQFQVYSPYTYDAVMVVADAIQRSGSVDRATIVSAVRQTNYQGLTARISFDSSGQLVNPAMTFFELSGGRKVPLPP